MKYACFSCDEENPCILIYGDVGEPEDEVVPTVCPFVPSKITGNSVFNCSDWKKIENEAMAYCPYIPVFKEDGTICGWREEKE